MPREEVHMQQLYNSHTGLNKILIFNREIKPDRITMIIVKEELGYERFFAAQGKIRPLRSE